MGQSKANFFTYDENKEKENTRKLLLNTGTILDTLIKEVRKGMKDLDPDFLEYAIKKAIRKGDKDKDAREKATEYYDSRGLIPRRILFPTPFPSS